MLKGERAEPYLTPSRERRHVCELCAPRAQQEGWIRESAAPETPPGPQRANRAARSSGARRAAPREPRSGEATPEDRADRAEDRPARAEANGERPRLPTPSPVLPHASASRRPARKPRHVRAVPTNAQLKIDRALDLFNDSEHPRTVAGIARALGTPRASASTSPVSAAQVLVTVAWELSWYQFTVDLSDAREPVQVRGQGQELAELPEQALRGTIEGAGRTARPGAPTEELPAPRWKERSRNERTWRRLTVAPILGQFKAGRPSRAGKEKKPEGVR